MSKEILELTPKLQHWIRKQKIFFVSTAPLSAEGHINCSPKGLDSLRILDNLTVAYQDFAGSGAETIAHLRENGRMVMMFCAFDGPPLIVRLHGRGRFVLPGDADFEMIAKHFPPKAGVRSFIVLHISRVADSCGYSVPMYTFEKDRDVLDKWVERKGENGIREYIQKKNLWSIDGLPALDLPPAPDNSEPIN